MNDPFYQAVDDLHALFGFAQGESLSDAALLDFRIRFLEEEVRELREAAEHCKQSMSVANISALLREMADVQAVLSGFAVSFGLPMAEAFQRVCTANRSKLVDGKPMQTPEGKMLKGPNFKPPVMDDLAAALLEKMNLAKA